jgi:hypothetical protein
MFRIEFHLSYQDQVCYDVYGHDTVRQIETYNANPYTLNYMRESFNHNGDATAFERNILSRQGGAVIRAVHGLSEPFPYRWSMGTYALFVGELYRMRADYMADYARKVEKYGLADWGEPELMRPVPRPIYFDRSMEQNRFQVEPWFNSAVSASIVNAIILAERMRDYDAIQGPRVGDWLDTPKGKFRIALRSKDSVQPTMYTAEENHGFYLGGAISYSGSLGEPVQLDRLQPTEEKRAGLVWIFSENDVRAHNSVYLKADFRVFRLIGE